MDHASTCWTVIHAAAAGSRDDGEEFALRYRPVIAAFLATRWRRPSNDERVQDAVQEVFLECFKTGGVLEHMAGAPAESFRSFLFGVVRNVAKRHESRSARLRRAAPPTETPLDERVDDETSMSRAFDRAWANAILVEAAALQRCQAEQGDAAARRRVELLRLRFGEDRPIRAIAQAWNLDAAVVHQQYRTARREFRRALLEVMGFHHPGAPSRARRELRSLLAVLGVDALASAGPGHDEA